MNHKLTFITGGIRSGKSRYALSLAKSYQGNKAFIATAEAFDSEMEERINNHKDERGEDFLTIEEPLDLKKAISSIPPDTDVAIVDCLTVWLGNLLHYYDNAIEDISEINDFLTCISNPPCDLIVVSNEVGMGIISDNEMARSFQNLSGTVNQKMADISGCVVMMISGIPLIVKGNVV